MFSKKKEAHFKGKELDKLHEELRKENPVLILRDQIKKLEERHTFKNFLHGIGIYRTPEEKKDGQSTNAEKKMIEKREKMAMNEEIKLETQLKRQKMMEEKMLKAHQLKVKKEKLAQEEIRKKIDKKQKAIDKKQKIKSDAAEKELSVEDNNRVILLQNPEKSEFSDGISSHAEFNNAVVNFYASMESSDVKKSMQFYNSARRLYLGFDAEGKKEFYQDIAEMYDEAVEFLRSEMANPSSLRSSDSPGFRLKK